jgi:hypothetical protein
MPKYKYEVQVTSTERGTVIVDAIDEDAAVDAALISPDVVWEDAFWDDIEVRAVKKLDDEGGS